MNLSFPVILILLSYHAKKYDYASKVLRLMLASKECSVSIGYNCYSIIGISDIFKSLLVDTSV